MSVEKERRDERQIVKQVQREGGGRERERETKGDSDRPDVLTLHSQSPVQWVQCEKLFMLIYVFSLSSAQSFVSIFSTLQSICAAFRTGCTIL